MLNIFIDEAEGIGVAIDSAGIMPEGMQHPVEIHALDSRRFQLFFPDRSCIVYVVHCDRNQKEATLMLEGKTAKVRVKDELDLLLEKMGFAAGAGKKAKEIKAPMPGLILSLKVASGDVVQKGDPLLVLEAMKMENIIKAPGEGTVKALFVKAGQSVEKNQLLIEFE